MPSAGLTWRDGVIRADAMGSFFAVSIYDTMSLDEMDFNYRMFLDRLTMLYGESDSGKSFVVVNLLRSLKPHVSQIIAVSPTDRQNHTYDAGIVPLPCIHYTITSKLLDTIWERQEALTNVYTRANRRNVLESLYKQCSNRRQSDDAIRRVEEKLCAAVREIRAASPDIETAKPKCENMLKEVKALILMIWRQAIECNRDQLEALELSKDEAYTLKYLNLNPRLVLIFDDCTELIKKFKNHPVIRNLFYQGRHSMVTTIIACHTDKTIDAEMRKNAFVSIFTARKSAHAFFTRPSNDFDKKTEQVEAEEACNIAFTPLAKYQKLAYVRLENKYYRFTAKSYPGFRFGSDAIWEYCDQIKSGDGRISADNRFISGFM